MKLKTQRLVSGLKRFRERGYVQGESRPQIAKRLTNVRKMWGKQASRYIKKRG